MCPATAKVPGNNMAKKMLIDATHPEETRVVVVDGNKVEDFDFESINKRQLAGNIYLAKVTRVEPSLQAAFVEYGGNRHGFLAFSEVHPDYYQIPIADREALLAEEEREEEERRAREESGEAEKPARKPRKRGGRSRKDKEQDAANAEAEQAAATAGAAVAGLEVIDIAEDGDTSTMLDDDSVPKGLEIAEPDPAEADVAETVVSASEPASAELAQFETDADNAQAPEAEAVNAVEPEVAVEADASEPVNAEAAETDQAKEGDAEPVPQAEAPVADGTTTGAEPAPDTSDDPDAPPRSIAESAGLDDEDRISEEIDQPDGATSRKVEAEAAEAPEVAETDTTEDTPAEPPVDTVSEPEASEAEPAAEAAPEPAESNLPEPAAAEEAPAEETSAEAAAGEGPAEESAQTDVDQADVGQTDGADSAPEAEVTESDEEQPKKSRRRRRSRKDQKRAEEEASDQDDSDDDDDDGDEVEQVGAEDVHEEVASTRTRLRRKYKIQDVIKVRQILLVQVVKEERGNKGAALTTYLSLAGRYCVLMPNTARGGGISRKIVNASDRKRLREITGELEVPKGMGLIVRTAGAERTRAEIKRDYEFLTRQWEQIRELTLKSVAPTLIYEEGSLIKRSIRDIYSKEIDQILVEGEEGYREAKEYMKMLMPSHAKNVQPYADPIPLFSRYQVESYLNGMYNPTVQLRSGGYIVIGVTEALVAIDVNSGRATKQGSIEETALQTNLEAAEEVARQLRLRDLAGLIVIDFIDMDENRNNRAVEKRMKDRLKNDRARIQVGRISAFGLMEMSRQRLRPGMLEATTQPCPHCMGTGLIRSDENLTLSILREVEEEGVRSRANQITIKVPVNIANYLINHKRETLLQIEQRHGVSVAITADPLLTSPNYEIERSKTAIPRPERQPAVVTSSSVVSDSDMVENAEVVEDHDGGEDSGNRKRRGKRGGRRRRGEDRNDERNADQNQTADGEAEAQSSEEGDAEGDGERKRSRRGGRRRRGGRNRRNDETSNAEAQSGDGMQVVEPDGGEAVENAADAATQAPVVEADAEQTDAPQSEAAEMEVAETDTAPEVATLEEVPAEAVTEAPAGSEAAEAPAEAEPTEPAETPAEPEPVLETVAAAPEPAPAPEEPPKPKRRGWWSFGR